MFVVSYPGRACRRFGAAALLTALLSAGAHAGDNALFASNEPLVLRLEAPFGALKSTKSKAQPEYMDGTLKLQEGGVEKAFDVRLRLRGHSRKELCDFPPLLLNFKTSDLKGSVLEGENKLKLVTHCKPTAAYDQYLLLEYLSYRALNLLTDMSLRARLLTVTYYDTERKRQLDVQPGMFIENEDRFAERKGLTEAELKRIEPNQYDRDALGLVNMFEYFIGNTDWSAVLGSQGSPCCHNIVPYQRPDGVLLPVPYDFDSSGMVNTPYALPNERLKINSVRQRLYRGSFCESLADFEPRFAKFDAVKPQLLELFSMSSGLDKRNAASATAYIDEFFETRSDPKKVERAFRAGCKN
ncbi:MAG TPA: hypothetical protein VMV37_03665 [Gammaproteobacteria bacterium]|nr:hypothetical protein [Gammaproteobacteria bacterium]